MTRIPRVQTFDSTFDLIRDPYRYISGQCRRYESDLFETRLLLREAICMTGPAAAQLFYDPARFERRGAMPAAIQKTLLGEGGVQGLDDDVHRHRKQMFMALMTQKRIEHLLNLTAAEWRTCIRKWTSMDEVLLYQELHGLLTRAVCTWAEVPLAESEVHVRTRELVALFDHAGSAGVRHLWSRWARHRADRWMEAVIQRIRSGQVQISEQSAASVIAWHRDVNGDLLAPHVAAVELLNVIRPTVAVSVFIVFVAHALHAHPGLLEKLAVGDPEDAHFFVQEVRRYYPFFPAIAARTRHAFEWNGYHFPKGRQVFLDLYGTNQDPRTWEHPENFEPERFRQWDENPFSFIPQGGGNHHTAHRCPGEWITIALMKQAADFLARHIRYDVLEQNLEINWSRMPALPRSRFVITNVREKS